MTNKATTIIVDPGSCHLGNLDMGKRLTDIAARCGADAIKWQLFSAENEGANIHLPPKMFRELKEYGEKQGIKVFASVFDRESVFAAHEHGCDTIKIAYSQTSNAEIVAQLRIFDRLDIIISADVMTNKFIWQHRYQCKTLYCHAINGQAIYPVIEKLDFCGLFPRFDGFSSHCLNPSQNIEAVRYGAKIIECHIQADKASYRDPYFKNVTCPDQRFALYPWQLEQMITEIRSIDTKKDKTYENRYHWRKR